MVLVSHVQIEVVLEMVPVSLFIKGCTSEPGILCSYKGGTGVDPSTCIPCSLRGSIGDGYSILHSEKNGTEDGLQYPRFREEVTLERDSCAEV